MKSGLDALNVSIFTLYENTNIFSNRRRGKDKRRGGIRRDTSLFKLRNR